MPLKVFDVTQYLDNEEAIKDYLNVCLEEGPDVFLSGLGKAAQAIGINSLAKKANLSRTRLYQTLTPGAKPRYETLHKLITALDLKLQNDQHDSPT